MHLTGYQKLNVILLLSHVVNFDPVQQCAIVYSLKSKKEVLTRSVSYRANRFNYAHAMKLRDSKVSEIITQCDNGLNFDWNDEVNKINDYDTLNGNVIQMNEMKSTESTIV